MRGGVGLAGQHSSRNTVVVAGSTLLALSTLACNPGLVAYREGRKAELRKDYDNAVIDFERALQYKPENPQYLLHDKLARTQAGYFHLKQGRRLLEEKRYDEATGEFQRAAKIDPSNQTAAQELAKLLGQQAAAKAERAKELSEALKPPEEPAAPLGVHLKPFPTEPLAHFRISADSRRVFEALGKFADVNVTFNWDFQPRPISLDLTNVKLEDALQAAAYEAHVFWKAVTPNTILIIPDSPTNRREYQETVVKTIHLSNPLMPADRTQITTALKLVLRLQNIVDNPNSNSIIIRDTPENVAAAEQVIKNLDLGKGEVLIDVTILEADRTRMQTLGIIPPTTVGLVPSTVQIVSGVPTAIATPITSIPLNAFGLLNQAYSLTLPTATAEAMLSDATTRVLQNPQLRATDGLVAKLKIGSRIPYATGSFLPSFTGTTSTGTSGLLASTQFQYQDIGVNLEITPHLTANGQIAMHAKVEISTQAGSETIGGLSEPVFGQRVIEHDIQLQEGEVSLLGGLIDRETDNSVAGLPGLTDVPVLKYLFSQTQKNVTDNEILIMLDPHIVRLPQVAPNTVSPVSADASGPLPPGVPFGEPQP
jgi:general secretion pathway protein D